MNKFFLSLLLPFVVLVSHSGFSQGFEVKKDLEPDWLAGNENGFIPYGQSEHETQVIYLKLRTPHPSGEYLRITGLQPFTVFVNNRLAATGGRIVLNLDSLSGVFSSEQLLIGIYQEELHSKTLKTELLSRVLVTRSTESAGERPSYFFRDFGILAALLLTIMIVVIIRLDPKLAADYFSIRKIFSLREDESQLVTRIGSSTSILFYIYCSLLMGYYFIVIFQFLPESFKVSHFFKTSNFGDAIMQWIKLSSILLIVLIAKIILILNLSFLFGITEVGRLHFFNWVRLMVAFFGVLTVLLFVYFIGHGYSEETHSFFLKLVVWIIGLWMIFIFLKLSGKANASMFHLFSYICATELIPFLLIIKVLYN